MVVHTMGWTGSGPSIDSVDAFARQLYRRARAGGAESADMTTVLRNLHQAVKHLRVEMDDPDSVLNAKVDDQDQHGTIYARQLPPMVQDCDFALRQLDMLLEKYGRGGERESADELESRERDMFVLVQKKLAEQKTNIDIFLDTVQLHRPAGTRNASLAQADSRQLDLIKDKVCSTSPACLTPDTHTHT